MNRLDEILEDPHKYGLPTIEEFKNNKEKYLVRDDASLASVDNGSKLTRKLERKHVFEIEGYRCKTIEEVERVALSQGIPLSQLEYRAEFIPLGAGKADVLIKFMSRSEWERRNAIDRAQFEARRRRV